MIVLYIIGWFIVGYFGLYKYIEYQKYSFAWNSRWDNNCKEDLIFDYVYPALFSFIGPISIIIFLIGFLSFYNDKRKFLKWRETEELKYLSIKQIRYKKLKKINK